MSVYTSLNPRWKGTGNQAEYALFCICLSLASTLPRRLTAIHAAMQVAGRSNTAPKMLLLLLFVASSELLAWLDHFSYYVPSIN